MTYKDHIQFYHESKHHRGRTPQTHGVQLALQESRGGKKNLGTMAPSWLANGKKKKRARVQWKGRVSLGRKKIPGYNSFFS